ncbi:histidine racemase CntK [Staphylococcus agnetis]|uniref:histidine racemase CntK n=1 Tax=Staphylococcus agnetis TaxID=985762 RepID=UPI000D1BB6A3|nr:histidine racemase CntK [Staphylococcus agnetis]PTH56777.1 histidine racemase CntK [Staphylococcus agnetis]
MKDIVHFSKFNPSGNMTVLVDSEHDASHYVTIANQLMQTSHVCCEQVGFVIKPQSSNDLYGLQMSGNEFCGNATLSLLHYLKERQLVQAGELSLHVSGVSTPTPCVIHALGDYEVTLPAPHTYEWQSLKLGTKTFDVLKITYASYCHFVVPIASYSEAMCQTVEAFVKHETWPSHFKTIGMMLYNADEHRLYPLIYVPELGSIIWEQSCGSGTGSIGIYEALNHTNGCADVVVHQPGGALRVCAQMGESSRITIRGHVKTVAMGLAYIE